MGSGAALVSTDSARALLVNWANQQDGWVRLLVSEVLSSASLAGTFLDEVYNAFLIEKDLTPGDPVTVSTIVDSGAGKDETEPLVLSKLNDLKNVNALAPDQAIEFNPKLTIVFGQNASGKTGYVRVVKAAAAVRTAERILPNVANTAHTASTPSALLTYQLGNQQQEACWNNESGLAPFTRIDVFDSRATNLHVDADLNYVYTPVELARFPRTQKALDGIKSRLEAQIAEATSGGNTFLPAFVRGTRAYTMIESLGASTDLAALTALASVTDLEKAELDGLRTEIDALKSSSPELQIKAATDLKVNVEALGKGFATLGSVEAANYNAGIKRVRAAEQQYEGVTRKSFAGFTIPGILEEPWRRFIEAGEQYLAAIGGGEGYPRDGSSCIYCQQTLSKPALDLLRKYRDFYNNTFRAELNEAQSVVEGIVAPLRDGLKFIELRRNLAEVLTAVPHLASSEKETLESVLIAAEDLVARMAQCQEVTWDKTGTEAARSVLRTTWEHNNKVLAELKSKKDHRENILREKEAKLADIDSRLKLAQLFSAVEEFVKRAKWADKAKIHLKKFAGIQRSLTEASKIASQKLLNTDFEARFKVECGLLRAPSVTLQFPGREGRVVRKKAVASDYRPSEVLSEGEQKVIALADFLAEAALKPAAPVVFDDPINSLDYIRMSEVVDRMVRLTQQRQVIVFTHNIWFATELLSRFEKRPADCSYYDVSREGESIGIVSKGTHPRSDTVKNLKGRINHMVQNAEKQTGEVRQALVEKAYELLRSLCEVIVETELLAGVTTRYRPNVQMTMLPQIKGSALRAAIDVILPVFEDCCRYIASHSQPLETLNVRPTLDIFRSDLRQVMAARDAYQAAS